MFLLGSCSSQKAAQPRTGNPRVGGGLTVLSVGDTPALDPFSVPYDPMVYGSRMCAVYDMLLETNPAVGGIVPRLAASLVPSPDYREWTLTLREGLRFSDGSPLDAAAVKKTWDMHADPAVRSVHGTAAGQLRTRLTGPLTLVAALDRPNAYFDHTISRHLNYIGAPGAMANLDVFRRQPVGAGPFLLTAPLATGAEVVEMRRNPVYWQGPPPLESLTFRVVPDGAAHPRLIDRGEADLAMTNSPTVAAAARDKGLRTEKLSLSGGQMIVFNTAKPPFDDARARQAFALALSSARINELAYRGTGTPAKGLFSQNLAVANANLATPENVPEEARKRFGELASSTGGRAGGVHATLLVVPVPETQAIAKYIQDSLNTYPGVQLDSEVISVSQLSERLQNGNFQVAFYQIWAQDPDPELYLFLKSGSKANYTRYAQREVDEALEAGRLSLDPEKRRDAYTTVQTRLAEDIPCWVYLESESVGMWGANVAGVRILNDGLFDFARLGRA